MSSSEKLHCLVPGCDGLTVTRLCDVHWFKLPLELRRRWWEETDYGKLEPTHELIEAIRNAHATDSRLASLGQPA